MKGRASARTDRVRLGRRNVRKPRAAASFVDPRPFAYVGKLSVAAPGTGAVRFWLALIFCILPFFWPAASLWAQEQAVDEEGRSRFCVVDIYLDSGSTPLAAYQLEFTATNGAVKIVGIEGGEHAAFKNAPFYDPKAIQHERVIVAAFNTSAPTELPTGKTRVATIHLMVTGSQNPSFALKLDVAADANGTKISPQASFEERKPDDLQ